MTEQFKEHLSALLDGELDRANARFLLRRLESDSELRGQWSRMHTARACLHRQHVVVRAGFVQAIHEAIAAEATPRRQFAPTALRWAGGFAVAASVALAALLVVPVAPEQTSPIATSVPATTQPVVGEVVSSGLRESDLRPDVSPAASTVFFAENDLANASSQRVYPQIDRYLLRHSVAGAHPWQASFAPLIPVSVKQPDPATITQVRKTQ